MKEKNPMNSKVFFEFLSQKGKGAKYIVDYTTEFKKNVKSCYKRNLELQLLADIVVKLAYGEKLAEKYRPHKLHGITKLSNENIWECHVQPNWLLIWKQNDIDIILILSNTGTHSDLFG
jgi:mRNA interferase YafQ